MNKYLAYYLRLSQDDGNINDSNSISNQRQLIKEYIYSSDEFIEAQTLEFVDDGYSGTNFNRPGIKQLLEAVKKGEIKCIIVKDFSRFGRNYLEVSKYIEQLFPYIGVRFIAVNDNYDSSNHKGTTAEIDVPVRNLINAMYSMDVSKKVKSALQARIKQGMVTSGRVIFGYKKDSIDRKKMIIDEPAAVVVRKIFQLALDGKTTFQIAEQLNIEGVSTPAVYKYNNGEKLKWHTSKNKGKNLWKSTTVRQLLCDERYIGTFIGSKKESGKVGSNEQIKKPRDEWVRIPNNHPAIITQEQFDIVSKMIHKYPYKKQNVKKNSNKPLYKKVRCGKCGYSLIYRNDTGNPFYSCKTARYTDEHGCMRGMIREKDLNHAIIDTLLTQIKLFADSAKILRTAENKVNKPNIAEDKSILQLENEIQNLQTNKRKLYEQYKREEINQILYFQERESLEKELAIKTTEHELLVSHKQIHQNILESTQQITQKFINYQPITELTKEVADEFIETINVYDSNRIVIKFTFRDEFEKLIKKLNGGN